MFTLYLTLYGQVVQPSTHESIDQLGKSLSKALDDAEMSIHPRAMTLMLALMFSDLRERRTWTWVGEDYEFFVARNDP